jgi:parvulin-like peptidyl-prolyl isomerase
VFVVAALAVGAAAGCRPERPVDAPPEPSAAKAGAATSRRGLDVVVARIGDREITLGEVEERLESLPVFVRVRYQAPERKIEFLENYVEFLALALAAEAEGYGSDPAVVDAVKVEVVDRHLRDLVDRSVRTSDITDDRVAAYYAARPELFHQPPRVEVAHVRLPDRETAAKVVFRARRMMEGPKVDTRDVFSGLAKQYSDDAATREAGGTLGMFPRMPGDAGVPPEVEAAALRLREVGDVSDPVESPDGWHVLFLADRKPAVDLSLEQARPRIVASLMDAERDRLRREVVAGALARPGVRIDEAAALAVIEQARKESK